MATTLRTGSRRFLVAGILYFVVQLAFDRTLAQPTNSPSTAPAPPSGPVASIDALIRACDKGDLTATQSLIEQGAPINGSWGPYKMTPLIVAACQSADVTRYLIHKGANVDAQDSEGNTALTHSCFRDVADSAIALLDAGANPNLANSEMRVPLMNAAKVGDAGVVAELLAHHADVNSNGPQGSAIWWAVHADKFSAVRVLTAAGANLNLKSTLPLDPKHPKIPLLSCAVESNDLTLIDFLLSHGMDVNDAAEEGSTPLAIATGSADSKVVLHLLDKGADANRPNDEGVTPLMLATDCKDVPTMKALLEHGAQIDSADKKGRTALIYACRACVQPSVEFLLSEGAKIDVVDSFGESPVTYAANRGRLELVQFLEAHGASPGKFHIIDDEKPDELLPPARAWALATAAIYTQINGRSHHLLGGNATKPDSARSLSEDWEIADRASLLRAVNELRDAGQRTEMQSGGLKLSQMEDADFQKLLDADAGKAPELRRLRDGYVKWKDKLALAWDLCRATNLVEQGFAAGYIDEREAWSLIMPIAQLIQTNFASWQEMSDNFLDGRRLGANEDDPEFDACAKLLLNPGDPNSPWTQLPWNTDLSVN
jgi:ankyrin repeat protein